MSSGWEEYGEIRWQLVICLFVAWVIVAVCLINGIQSSGKVVYFTALFPYLVLLIFLIYGAMLPGAKDGVLFYLTPQWERLASVGVWYQAAAQVFYSLGPAFGGLLTLASFNRFNNNCQRDGIVVGLSNCMTSFFAGFVIYSVVGFMANELGVEVKHVIRDGTGLAFVAYPDAVARMPVPQFWAFLFFFMLVTLGLDSQVLP
ncbi:unnamed protein product [Darwinula stevensoni]|uniref:Uncharacterized protein n=1 Tax=Darwinula stevensoni TaxID=69355 RepID=A0A7R9ADY9_9CRUS|nr:unnamed protein product [Darwinula stevensoni]CAG0901798.1 unnamed protein product [Darwinula stevensoni]